MRGTDRGNPAPGDLTRRLAFGMAAEQYDLIRPGYPGDLVTAVLAHCGGTGAAAVEAGAGTGKATRAPSCSSGDISAASLTSTAVTSGALS